VKLRRLMNSFVFARCPQYTQTDIGSNGLTAFEVRGQGQGHCSVYN